MTASVRFAEKRVITMKICDYILRQGRIVRRKILKILKLNYFYYNDYGFKMIMGKININHNISCSSETYILPDDLLLGVDGLFDNYSHMGKRITESPHYRLMKACDRNDFINCEYLMLENKGALDSRESINRSIEKHLNVYNEVKSQIEEEKYTPVSYYIVDEKKYIHDGKHRAAMCAYLGKKVKCVEVSPTSVCSEYMIRLKREIVKKPGLFTKHQRIIEVITSDKKTKG